MPFVHVCTTAFDHINRGIPILLNISNYFLFLLSEIIHLQFVLLIVKIHPFSSPAHGCDPMVAVSWSDKKDALPPSTTIEITYVFQLLRIDILCIQV